MPNHFTLTFFLLRRRDVSCSHSNRDLFTCEDNMLFSHVKISCFRAKAHLVFHWYLYNKLSYFKNKTQLCDSFDIKLRGRFMDTIFAYHNPRVCLTEPVRRSQTVPRHLHVHFDEERHYEANFRIY